MPEFRKKPVVIEAMQFTLPITFEFLQFGGGSFVFRPFDSSAPFELEVKTLEDGNDGRVKHVATLGDWIIKGVRGELYPCKPDIFKETYDPVAVGD